MKKIIYIVTCIALFSACKEAETKQNVKAPGPVKNDGIAEYALPLSTALDYTRRYDSLSLALLGQSAPIKAYTIRAIDLAEALGLPTACVQQAQYDHIRVYIGMDSTNKFRLFLTPVQGADIVNGSAGNDVILDGQFTEGNQTSGDPLQNGQYVLDFTGPCPNSCPTNSPFNYNPTGK